MSGHTQCAHITAVLVFLSRRPRPVAGPDPGFRINPPLASERQLVMQPLQQAILNSAVKQTTHPRIHLIPGTLGSQLSRNSGDQDLPFWGTITIKDVVKDRRLPIRISHG
jgi:hypothetical protein